MDTSIDLTIIRDLGIGTIAFLLVYALLKSMIARSFVQADAILELAKTTIAENTKSLETLHQSMINHIRQNDDLIKTITNGQIELKKEFDEMREDSKPRTKRYN